MLFRSALIMSENRPREELYDLEQDPYELKNLAVGDLAADPEVAKKLGELRQSMKEWLEKIGDPIEIESEEVYGLEAGAEHLEGGKGNRTPQYQRNLELMKRWRTERPFVRPE